MEDLRIGLAGYGDWARNAYVPALREDRRARVVAAAARSPETRERIAGDLGTGVTIFDHFEALVASSMIDAVFVALPDGLHEAALTAALDVGLPTLYEPPVADRIDRIRPMLHRLLATDQVTHADLELSYLPIVARVAELIACEALGKLRTAAIRLWGSWDIAQGSSLSIIHQLGPWYLDALDRALNRRPRRILVLKQQGMENRSQAFALANLDYGDLWGQFQVNLGSSGGLETTLEVIGDDGDIRANLITGNLRWRTRQCPDWHLERGAAREPRAYWPGMHECVGAFLDALEAGGPSTTGPATIARQHLAGLAAEESITTGGWAEIEDVVELQRQTRDQDG